MSARFLFRYVLIIVFVWIGTLAFGQSVAVSGKAAKLVVKSRVQKNRILLRWAVDNAPAWKLANKYGFKIERYTIMRSGSIVNTPEKKILTPLALKPAPIAKWATMIDTSNDAAVIAQALYGESFQVGSMDNKLATIINQSEELNQRYAFSLVAADRNFQAATLAGWAFTDTTVREGEKYFYKVYAVIPKSLSKIDTATVYLGLSDYEELPVPKDLSVLYGDKAVMITWNYALLKDVYNTYYIERSENGGVFKRISDLPITTLNENEENTPSRMFFTDTLADNNTRYSYRIRGLTSFGETGPPSDSVNGSGKQVLPYVPGITNTTITNDSSVVIQFEFPFIGEKIIDHFELRLSPDASEKSFKTVEKIAKAERVTEFRHLMPVNYFSVVAVDSFNNERSSFPVLVQPVDSIPPAIPTGLKGVIDTLGNITLTWARNTERDLLGYTILKGNLKNEEPSVINSDPIAETVYKERINLKTLNSKIYYSIIAIDKRMNQSAASAPVEIIKPDQIPPVNPVFINYDITEDNKVRFSWIRSSSDDVVSYAIYRKRLTDAEWQRISLLKDSLATGYEDAEAPTDELLAYTITATDRSDNESEPATPLTLIVQSKTKLPVIKKVTAILNKESNSVLISTPMARRMLTYKEN